MITTLTNLPFATPLLPVAGLRGVGVPVPADTVVHPGLVASQSHDDTYNVILTHIYTFESLFNFLLHVLGSVRKPEYPVETLPEDDMQTAHRQAPAGLTMIEKKFKL